MPRSFIIVSIFISVLYAFGCGGGNVTPNSNAPSAANANTNTNVKVAEVPLDPANMPPGISANPVIYDAANKNANAKLPKGTPTPGIPSETELRRPMKPGATPTPGIPSPEELKKMMSGNPPAGANVNTAPPSMMKRNSNTPPMMKTTKPRGGKPQP